MTDLKTITGLVKHILETCPETRYSDNNLYYQVLKRTAKENGFSLAGMTVAHFLEHMYQYGFPPFESVRRARQKVQRKYPELAAGGKVAEARNELETVYRDYARSDIPC